MAINERNSKATQTDGDAGVYNPEASSMVFQIELQDSLEVFVDSETPKACQTLDFYHPSISSSGSTGQSELCTISSEATSSDDTSYADLYYADKHFDGGATPVPHPTPASSIDELITAADRKNKRRYIVACGVIIVIIIIIVVVGFVALLV